MLNLLKKNTQSAESHVVKTEQDVEKKELRVKIVDICSVRDEMPQSSGELRSSVKTKGNLEASDDQRSTAGEIFYCIAQLKISPFIYTGTCKK